MTGIYNTINNQTAEIKKWYKLMINIRAEQCIQSIDLDALKKSIDRHQTTLDITLDEYEGRIRTLETVIIPTQP